jgi:hypothetical protein
MMRLSHSSFQTPISSTPMAAATPFTPTVRTHREGGLYFPHFDKEAGYNLMYAYSTLQKLFANNTAVYRNRLINGMKFEPSQEFRITMHQAEREKALPFELKQYALQDNPHGSYIRLEHPDAINPKDGKLKPDFAHLISRLEQHLVNFIVQGIDPDFPSVPVALYDVHVKVEHLDFQRATPSVVQEHTHTLDPRQPGAFRQAVPQNNIKRFIRTV